MVLVWVYLVAYLAWDTYFSAGAKELRDKSAVRASKRQGAEQDQITNENDNIVE